MGATLVLFKREVLKWVNRRAVLAMSIVTPIFWIALFGKSFNILNILNSMGANVDPRMAAAIREAVARAVERLFGTTDYFTYVATGMLAVFALFQSMSGAIGVVFDRRIGYLTRLLVAPIPRLSIFMSKVLGTIFRITVLSGILLAVAYGMGAEFKPGLGILDLATTWAVIALLSLGLSSIFTGIAFNVDNHEVLFSIVNLANLPLMFTSSALFPREQMPSWLQSLAAVNPITHAADLARYFLIGKQVEDPVASLAYLAGAAALLTIAGYALARRGLREA
ncbi:ABC transporter permease [Stetteria hydrogenophila]